MVPLVRWLNHFDNVFTLYCCQGDDETPAQVMFFARIFWCLEEISNFARANRAKLASETEKAKDPTAIVYFLRFRDIRHLRKSIEWLRRHDKI